VNWQKTGGSNWHKTSVDKSNSACYNKTPPPETNEKAAEGDGSERNTMRIHTETIVQNSQKMVCIKVLTNVE